MWNATFETLNGGRVRRIVVRRDQLPVSYEEVLRLWQHDEEFREFFVQLLAGESFPAYRWETPAITTATASRDFEFVLLEAPELDRAPDAQAFADQFRSALNQETVLVFPNLGNDAVLVVPCPVGRPSIYGHLAAFIREAPEAQKHELWRVVGVAMQARLGSRPVWLSTAGMGVSWLHVRLDSRPKYYSFQPYR